MAEPRWTIDRHGCPRFDGLKHVTVITSSDDDYGNATIAPAAFAALVAAVRDAERLPAVRRVAYELAHGNRPRLFEGRLHWYSPDENGHPHFVNAPLTDQEAAEWEAIQETEGDSDVSVTILTPEVVAAANEAIDMADRIIPVRIPTEDDAEVAEWEALEAGE